MYIVTKGPMIFAVASTWHDFEQHIPDLQFEQP